MVLSLVVLYGGWRFIHSEKFSKDVSIRVSKILTKKFGAKLSFTGVEFKLIPLSTTFKNVIVEKEDPNLLALRLNAEELRVTFTYSSFLSSNLVIEEAYLNRGNFKLNIFKESEEDVDIEKINPTKIFADYQSLLEQLPVRLNILALKSIDAQIDGHKFFINDLKLAPQRRQIRLKADIGSLAIQTENKSKPVISADGVKTLVLVEKNVWTIEDLQVLKGQNSVSAQASFKNEKGWLVVDGKTSINGRLEEMLGEIPQIPQEILPMSAQIKAEAKIEGRIGSPDLLMNFNANAFKSQWIELEKVVGEVRKKRSLIILEKLTASNGHEKYLLKQRHAVFDINPLKFTDFHLKLRLTDAYSNTFLHYLKDDLDKLKFNVSGDVDVKLDSTKASFHIDDRAVVKNFRLTAAKSTQKDVLKNAGFELTKTVATIHSDNSLSFNATINGKNTALTAQGKLGNGKIDVLVDNSKIDLKTIGPIAGIELTGNGPTQMHIYGPMDDIQFDFVVDWQNFSLIDLHFGQAKAKFQFSLADLRITIDELEGNLNQTNYNAEGTLDFEDKKGMDLRLNLVKATFKDARQMMALVFKKLKTPIMPEFNFTSNITIKGGYAVEDLKIEGTLRGSEIKIGDEEADRLFSRFSLSHNHLNFKQLKINKARGQMMANVSLSLANNYIELNGAAQGLRLNDFGVYRRLNFEYDGDLFLDFDGNGTTDNFNSRFKLRLANAFIGNVPASSSNALFYVNSDDVVTNASLLGGKIKLDSLLKIKTGMTATKASIETADIREILGIISGHNIGEKSISGKIKADLNTQISLNGEGVRKFVLNVSELNLKKGNIDMSVDPRYNKIEVDEGNVKVWDLRFRDGEDFFVSKGRNISNGVIALDQRFSIKANLLEFVSDFVDRAVGVIKGSNQIVLEKKFEVKEFAIGADKLSMKLRNLPGFFNDMQFNIIKKGDVYELTKLTGNYGEGDIRVTGRFLFDDLYPQINLDYRIDRATIPLFKKSNVLVSSTGTLSGTELPYKLIGKIFFLHGEFLDDPTDFTKEGKVTIDEYKKYLPQKDLSGKKAFLDVNLAFDILNPLVLKNNMAEVYFKGNGQATGDVMAPELNTRLEIVPNLSKFKFKGHDFALSQGYVEIRDRGKNRLSDLKFTGVSKINEYDMKLDLSGNISKVNVDLSSEPALSKEDLLSLITFGVTSDMSKNLEAGDRKFVTTVGIGTLLVDQLKINEDLNSTLGLKLSVQPEFKENESTLIQGKAAVSDSSTSRLKSATKIKINKQVTNKVDVSLSSTVGGSLEQKQEMNVNFNINKNLSVEGVYEMKPTESENTNTPSSLGADLKYRWSF